MSDRLTITNPRTLVRQRRQKGMSQRDLATAIERELKRMRSTVQPAQDIDGKRSMIGLIERGIQKDVHEDVALAIAKILDIDLGILFLDPHAVHGVSTTNRRAS